MSRRTTTNSAAAAAASAGDNTNPASPVKGKSSTAQSTLLAAPSSQVGHFSTLRALQVADYITLLNGFCGVSSILSSMRYCLSPDTQSFGYLWAALAFMPFGLFFDFMDGKVARSMGKGEGSLLGQELDSLADLVSFGLSPAMAAFALGLRTQLDTLVLTAFVLCGLTRLARFNVTVDSIPRDASGKSKYFEGLPIPTSLTIVGGMAYALSNRWVLEDVVGGVWAKGTALEVHPVVGIFAVWGSLMLSRSLKVPKP